MLLDAGISRFKCSTIAEAEMLGREGAADVLLAYQPTRLKAKRLARLRQAFLNTVFSCLVDSGSPTFPCHARRAGLECNPGTFSLWVEEWEVTARWRKITI